MKTKIIASAAFMLFLSVFLCLSGENAFAQVAGLTTRVHSGATLPVGAEPNTVFILTTGSPQIYICNNSPSCTTSGQWVTNSGSVAGANIALSNLSGVAVNTALYAATGVTMTVSGFPGASSLNPTGASILGGAAYTATSQTPGSVIVSPGPTAAVGATPANISLTGAAGFGTTGSGSNIYLQTGAGGSTSPLKAGLLSFGLGGATPVASETSPLTGSYVPSAYFLAGASTYGGEIDFVNAGSSNGVIRITGMPFAFYADNTYNFDLAAYRPMNMYLGTGFYLGSTTIGFTGETSAVSGNLMAAGTVAGTSKLLCTDSSGNLTITTSLCPVVPTIGTLVSNDYVSASGPSGEQDSGVAAGPYLGSALPWETAPNCSSATLSMIGTANKGYIFGLALEFPAKTSTLWYDVITADNSANTYDVALYQGAPSGTENRIVHIGATSSTGQPGTTFAPAIGWQHLNWLEGATILNPGRYYLLLTSSCTAGGTSCAQLAVNATSAMFYWPGTGGVSITTGGASPTTYTSSADSPSFSTVPCLFVE
jgi:hypothetical protein